MATEIENTTDADKIRAVIAASTPQASDYRPNVALVLVNRTGQIFVGKHVRREEPWIMPQGGIQSDETLRAAIIREAKEETGLKKLLWLATLATKQKYDYERPQRSSIPGVYWRGQEQQYVMVLDPSDGKEVDILTGREFSQWRWCEQKEVVSYGPADRQIIYHRVLAKFAPVFEAMEALEDPAAINSIIAHNYITTIWQRSNMQDAEREGTLVRPTLSLLIAEEPSRGRKFRHNGRTTLNGTANPPLNIA